jgi:hypothetical protein
MAAISMGLRTSLWVAQHQFPVYGSPVDLFFPHRISKVRISTFSLFEFADSETPVAVIDRTALYVARSANPPLFEERVREGQRTDPKFSFLNPADPYHAYYIHRMDKVARGEVDEELIQKDKPGEQVEQREPVECGVEPPPAEFILELPNISSIDL